MRILALIALITIATITGCAKKKEIVAPPVTEIDLIGIVQEAKEKGVDLREHNIMTDEGIQKLYIAVKSVE